MVLGPMFLSFVSPKLQASKVGSVYGMVILQNQWKTNLCRQNQYFNNRPYIHTS